MTLLAQNMLRVVFVALTAPATHGSLRGRRMWEDEVSEGVLCVSAAWVDELLMPVVPTSHLVTCVVACSTTTTTIVVTYNVSIGWARI